MRNINLKNLAIVNFYSMVQISEAMVSKVKLLLKLIQIIECCNYKDQWERKNEEYLLNLSHVIKTDKYDKNLKLYIDEGKKWMKKNMFLK